MSPTICIQHSLSHPARGAGANGATTNFATERYAANLGRKALPQSFIHFFESK